MKPACLRKTCDHLVDWKRRTFPMTEQVSLALSGEVLPPGRVLSHQEPFSGWVPAEGTWNLKSCGKCSASMNDSWQVSCNCQNVIIKYMTCNIHKQKLSHRNSMTHTNAHKMGSVSMSLSIQKFIDFRSQANKISNCILFPSTDFYSAILNKH